MLLQQAQDHTPAIIAFRMPRQMSHGVRAGLDCTPGFGLGESREEGRCCYKTTATWFQIFVGYIFNKQTYSSKDFFLSGAGPVLIIVHSLASGDDNTPPMY